MKHSCTFCWDVEVTVQEVLAIRNQPSSGRLQVIHCTTTKLSSCTEVYKICLLDAVILSSYITKCCKVGNTPTSHLRGQFNLGLETVYCTKGFSWFPQSCQSKCCSSTSVQPMMTLFLILSNSCLNNHPIIWQYTV